MATEPKEKTEPLPRTNRLTPERRAAILAVAGSRPHDPTAEAWMEEIARYREQIQQQEIAAQEARAKE